MKTAAGKIMRMVYERFCINRRNKTLFDFKDGFNEKQKTDITNGAATAAGQVLMTAVVLCCLEKEIYTEMVYPDGSKWRLSFKKVESEDTVV